MAKFITRTINSTKAQVMVVDIAKAETLTGSIELAGTFKDDKAILKAVEKNVDSITYPTDLAPQDVKVVAVLSAEVVETLYGMEEQKFMELAQVMPPRPASQQKKAQ